MTKDKVGDNFIYGMVTIGMNWLPGVVAAIHIISMYRTTLKAKNTLVYAGNAFMGPAY